MLKLLTRLVKRHSPGLRAQKLGPVLEELRAGARVLDIGVWCAFPEPHPGENWLEKQAPGSGQLIAAGLEPMGDFKKEYPHVWCVQADGCALPFSDGAVDIAVSNAVLEHVHVDGQQSFVEEIARVSSKWSWLSVPDRLCPVEIHSRLPLLHWLPFWRKAFCLAGHHYWARSDILCLFSRRKLLRLLRRSSRAGDWHIRRQTLLCIPVSLLARLDKHTS